MKKKYRVTDIGSSGVKKFLSQKIIEEYKKILNLDDMNDVNYVKYITEKEFKQNDMLFKIFSSIREKANAPSRNRVKNK